MKKRARSCGECELNKALDKCLNNLLDTNYKDADLDKSRLDRKTALSFLMGNTVRVYMTPEAVQKTTIQYPRKIDGPTYELLYTLINHLGGDED